MASLSWNTELAGALAIDAILVTGYFHYQFLLMIARTAVIYAIFQHAPLMAIMCGFFAPQSIPVTVISLLLRSLLSSKWLQPWRFANSLPINIFQEWYEALMRETKHILIFGSTGTGKSTLVNHITGSNLTTSNRATGVTLSSAEESKRHNGVDYRIIDTAGLNEGDNGTVKHIDALTNLVRLLNKTEGGLNLMVMVTRGKIVKTTIENYRLFVEVMTSNKVPTIIVQTNLDDEENPCDWVKKNWGAFKDQNLKAVELVGTAFPQYRTRHTHNKEWARQTCQESTERVWTAIERWSSETPISYLADRAGFVMPLRKVWNVFARNYLGKEYVWVSHEMVTVIKKAANLSEKEAKGLAQEAEVCRS